jgi:Ser/Thr protein kinase RdoA (MazF antagonist)
MRPGRAPARRTRLWAHNDWHVSNLLWRDGQVSTALDFGLASPTSALFDLATAIERNAVAWLELERGMERCASISRWRCSTGYRQVLPLSAARVHLLADLLPMVHFDFALSEVEYFEGVTGSTANADVAWQPFMLGHPAWFHSARTGTAAGAARRRVTRLSALGQIPSCGKDLTA